MKGVYALYEALSCKPFICNEQLLIEYFDPPFQMVQTNKRLILQTYLPATTHFLFSFDHERHEWATIAWTRMKRPPTMNEFDWAIREPLLGAMGRVQIQNIEIGFSPTFWSGLRLILSRLNKNIVTHAVRGMEYDVYKLVLDHLQVDSSGYLDVVRALNSLITLSPSDFWDSMGSISPGTIAEQIFGSAVMDFILADAIDEEKVKVLSEVLAWVNPFMASIKASNRTPACRALIHQLMDRCQDEKYPQIGRSYCFKQALEVLNMTLQALIEGDKSSTFAGNATIYDILSLIMQHVDSILEPTHGLTNTENYEDTVLLPIQVIEKALTLDCIALNMYREKAEKLEDLVQEKDTNSIDLWQKIVNSVRLGDQALASHILLGTLSISGLEEFIPRKDSVLKAERIAWNSAFEARCGHVTALLDRVNDFEPFDIAGLFKTRHLACGIVAPLLSSNADVRQGAVAIYKTLAQEDGRRESIRYILEQPYERFLLALADIMKLLRAINAYTPMVILIRLSMDVNESLCDSQNGILRSKNLTDMDAEATKLYWKAVWRALDTIFTSTENWSLQGHDKAEMQDFCRDTMQFAEAFFDSYDIYVNAVAIIDHDTGQSNSSDVANDLLSIPKETMGSMVMWLRLRDEYLAEKIVKLVSKLLIKLREIQQEVREKALDYINRIVTGEVKAKLSPQQCAQLQRAWEIHTGRRMPRPDLEEIVKPRKQGSLNEWIMADKQRQRQLERKDSIAESTKATQLYKERMASKFASSAAKAKEPSRPLLDAAAIKKRKEEADARKKADVQRAKVLRGETITSKSVIETKDKEPAYKGDSMMVSSDSESDREAALDELLGFGKRNKEQASKSANNHIFANIPEPARRPVKVNRIVRSTRDMRARLAPDLSTLHKEILGWDYFHDGEFPPGSSPQLYKAVPKKFKNIVEYKNIFRPLLTLEAWQGFVKAREENSFKPYDAKVVTRATVNAFIEISTTVVHSDNQDQQPSEGDVVLFSNSKTPQTSAAQPHCLARVLKVTRKKQLLEVLYRAMPTGPFTPQFGANSIVHAVKIQSITPLEREYGALIGLEYYDLADYILNARPSYLLQYTDHQLDPISKNYQLNKAQAKAVKSALDNDAFTLIQGPPGSGKTKTIVAIVGALLSDCFRDEGSAVQRPTGTTSSSRPAKKLLVCAPSNAAVDELVMRFKQGIRTMKGFSHSINVVRLGRSEAINAQVLDVTLEELVNKRLNVNNSKESARAKTQKITKEHQEVSEKLRLAREKENSGVLKTGQEMTELLAEIQALSRRKKDLGNLRDAALDKEQGANRAAELARKQAQQAVLDSAHVICATLSGSGHEMFQNLNLEFETVVVDEAAQCVEMSALIPLKYGCAKCILVGDPKQLPPTVFSREAAHFQYEQSLFQRMQTNDADAVHMLDTQYRMHPEISKFPSITFYDSRLLDGPGMDQLRQQPWHENDLLGPYRFFDVEGRHQSDSAGHSLINKAEVDIADALYSRLTRDYSTYDFRGKIGIITPYKSQLRELKWHFTRKYGQAITDVVEFNTTDAFQGRESEVIIFSCVRAQPKGSVGFLADIRRMNVGLTRAKSSLWVLGNADTLVRGEFWRKLIDDSKARDRFLVAEQYLGPLKEPNNSTVLSLKPTACKAANMAKAPVTDNTSTAQMMPDDAMNIDSDSPAGRSHGHLDDTRPTLSRRSSIETAGSRSTSGESLGSSRKAATPNGPVPKTGEPDAKQSERNRNSDSTETKTHIRPKQPPLRAKDRPAVKRRPVEENNPLLIRKKPKKG